MSRIVISGSGSVTPAGWGLDPLREALAANQPFPTKPLKHPGRSEPVLVRPVPSMNPAPAFLKHARLRRASPITQFAVAAALEGLNASERKPDERLGIVLCVMAGCVNYSRRFYAETARDPATASPLVFPETVFNAPASHIATLLGATNPAYTLVGDPGMFLLGLALAADWLLNDDADVAVVVGAEELDWLTVDAFQLFTPGAILAEGAGALVLRRADSAAPDSIELHSITDPELYSGEQDRRAAAVGVRQQLPECCDLLCDSRIGHARFDSPETAAWSDWNGARLSPKLILGEGLAAASAWQCVAAIDALNQSGLSSASVVVTGTNQQAVGAHFIRCGAPASIRG